MGPGTEVGDGAADGWMGVGQGEGGKKNWMGKDWGEREEQVGVSDGFQVGKWKGSHGQIGRD